MAYLLFIIVFPIEENDTPFFYPGAYKTRTDHEKLLETTRALAEQEGIYENSHPFSLNLLQSFIFKFSGESHDTYLGNVLIMQSPSGYKKLILFQDITENRIRSPLAVIQTAAETISDAPETSDKFLSIIKSECRIRKIILSAEHLHSRTIIRVKDFGPGIPDEEKALIFDPFYRNNKARNQKEHFGLGLSIAINLAAIQYMKLTITDTPGGGSTFEVIING